MLPKPGLRTSHHLSLKTTHLCCLFRYQFKCLYTPHQPQDTAQLSLHSLVSALSGKLTSCLTAVNMVCSKSMHVPMLYALVTICRIMTSACLLQTLISRLFSNFQDSSYLLIYTSLASHASKNTMCIFHNHYET